MCFDEDYIRGAVSDPALPVYFFDSIDSTNLECRRRMMAGETRCLAIADAQTAGRGRRGRSFFSPPGAGLYLSLGFRPEGGAASVAGITTYAAVVVAEAVSRLGGIECGIKWVNDLYLDGKKVCGILAEAVGDAVIVGIGVNLTESAVPEELRSIVGWLGRADIRDALAAGLANGLLRYIPGDTRHMEEYRRRSLVLGRRVCFGEGGEGIARAIADDGALIVETAGGSVELRSGEISLTEIEGLK